MTAYAEQQSGHQIDSLCTMTGGHTSRIGIFIRIITEDISLSAWVDYCYTRYYWYGCHPYYWYGYYPIAREVVGDTYNYYTYNYYDDTPVVDTGYTAYDAGTVDHTTFADIREKLAQQAEEPAEPTLADRYFEDAIKAFESNDYNRAAELFAQAMELAPDDMILPFAYCQALFAAERYTEAAEVLRAALAKVSPEEEGIFYPRGLYSKDDILFEQMNKLADKAALYSFDGDLQLLLGYNLLGIGELDEAVEPLRLATLDLENAPAATVLLNLLEKMRIQSEETLKENADKAE
jgi:tetratricopeptide (TPR) repeat protein